MGQIGERKKQVVEKSGEWVNKTPTQPQPEVCLCFTTRYVCSTYLSSRISTVNKVTVFSQFSSGRRWCNLLSWPAVAAPDFSVANPSLPIAGGQTIPHLGEQVLCSREIKPASLAVQVHNVGVHPSVLREEGKLVDEETLENIARLVGKFLEQREPGLEVTGHQVRAIISREYVKAPSSRWTRAALTSATLQRLSKL